MQDILIRQKLNDFFFDRAGVVGGDGMGTTTRSPYIVEDVLQLWSFSFYLSSSRTKECVTSSSLIA